MKTLNELKEEKAQIQNRINAAESAFNASPNGKTAKILSDLKNVEMVRIVNEIYHHPETVAERKKDREIFYNKARKMVAEMSILTSLERGLISESAAKFAIEENDRRFEKYISK